MQQAVPAAEVADQTATQRWRWKNVVLATVMIIGGVGLHTVTLWPGASATRDAFLKELGTQVAAALLIGGLWTLVNEFMLRREFLRILETNAVQLSREAHALDESLREGHTALSRQIDSGTGLLLRKIEFAKQAQAVGLVEVHASYASYDFKDLILNSSELMIVSNNANAWIARNAEALRKRFSDPKRHTTFILLHPSADVLETLARKYGTERDDLRKEIRNTVNHLRVLGEGGGKVSVYGHFLVNAYSSYVGDEYAVIVPYVNAPKQHPRPLLRITDREGQADCLYKHVRRECSALAEQSLELLELPPSGSASAS